MTRINVIPPHELTREHLLAEYRELPRVFGVAKRAQDRGLTPHTINAPPHYVLGKGHVLFFAKRLRYALRRQNELIEEMIRRGYDPRHRTPEALCEGIHVDWFGDYTPTNRALTLNRCRIATRLRASKDRTHEPRASR